MKIKKIEWHDKKDEFYLSVGLIGDFSCRITKNYSPGYTCSLSFSLLNMVKHFESIEDAKIVAQEAIDKFVREFLEEESDDKGNL